MAPKALIVLPLLAPFTLAWGTTHDLYVRDAMPAPDPYAYEQALAARALAARKVYAAKARRAANGKVVLSRQVNARAPQPKPKAHPEAHAFQQYDAGLFRRDGSVIPRDPYAYPGASAVAEADPELWFEGGELYAREHADDDEDLDEEEEERRPKKSSKKGKKAKKHGKKSHKGQKNLKKGKKAEEKKEKKEKDDGDDDDDSSESSKEEKKGKGTVKSWFSWFRW